MNKLTSKSTLNGMQHAVSGASSSDLPDIVKIMYTDNNTDTTLLEEEIKEKINYLEMIWTDTLNGGRLFENLYSGVTREQIIESGRPGTHAEVLAVNELIKELKVAGKFTSIEDLKKISVFTKGKTDCGEYRLSLCVHCFYMLPGIKVI